MKKSIGFFVVFLMVFSLSTVLSTPNAVTAQDAGWQELSTGSNGLMKDIAISSIAIDPQNSNIIYAGTDFYGVYKSEDGGSTWKCMSNIQDMINVTSLAINPQNPKIIYAGLFNFGRPRIYKSEDGGLTWNALQKSPQYPVYEIAVDPNNGNTLYAYSHTDGFYRSIDGGLNWTKLSITSFSFKHCCIAIDPKNSNVVYIVQYGIIYKSEDKGDHWSTIQIKNNGSMCAVLSVTVAPDNSNVLYASTDGFGIFKSTDSGVNWTQTSLSNANAETIVVSPNNSRAMYAIDNPRRALEATSDSWNSWKYLDLTGLPTNMSSDDLTGQGALRSLAIDSKNNLFLATSKGIFEQLTFTITASAGTGGTISPLGAVTVNSGESKKFTITPNSGYKISDVKVDVVSVGAVSTYTFENVTLDHTIEAIFEPLTYTITTSSSYGGSISPSGIGSVNYGSSITFTIMPATGYRIFAVKVDGKSVGSVSSYTFTNITSDHTIEAVFEKENKETVIILQIGNKEFTVNGETRTLDSPPIIKNSRTLLPIRAVVEALGGTVGWDATERKVTITLSSTTIELWIGKSTAKVNGVNTPIDPTNPKVVPEIVNSRTKIPFRFVAESLGATVNWVALINSVL